MKKEMAVNITSQKKVKEAQEDLTANSINKYIPVKDKKEEGEKDEAEKQKKNDQTQKENTVENDLVNSYIPESDEGWFNYY